MQCKVGHVGCGRCVGELSGNRCKQCERPAKDAVVLATMVQCPHEGCRSLVASNVARDHYIACPHGPCRCTEVRRTGCDFTGPPLELLVHLAAFHSKPLFRFQYGMPWWCILRAPLPPQGHMFIGYAGEDGSVFAITVGMLSSAIAVSCVCIRSVACSSPRYTVQLLAIGPPAPAGTTDSSTGPSSTDTLMAVIEPTSTPTPSEIAFHQLTSFLAVPPRYLRDAGPYRQLNVSVCINKKIIS